MVWPIGDVAHVHMQTPNDVADSASACQRNLNRADTHIWLVISLEQMIYDGPKGRFTVGS